MNQSRLYFPAKEERGEEKQNQGGAHRKSPSRNRANRIAERFRTGVSLHSHTLHSRESLNFIYHASRKSALLRNVLRHGEQRYRQVHGTDLDLNRGWWTPPLAPLDAYQLEAGQITDMGLDAIVSITDHDTIDAPMGLQAIESGRKVPVSVEWTVPLGPTFFHLGIHNLLPHYARPMMERLAGYTLHPDPETLTELLEEINANPNTLVVFNHPLWDEKGVGADIHRQTAVDFLKEHRERIHAMEINGLRPWSENLKVVRFAEEWSKPIISGGDRHAVEPNATLNLTNATDFAEFAQEIRTDGWSEVLVMPHYHHAHASRIFHNMLDVFRTYEDHGNGWTQWSDRVFFTLDNGVISSLTEIWGDSPPATVGIFASFMRFAGRPRVRLALRSFAAQFATSID